MTDSESTQTPDTPPVFGANATAAVVLAAVAVALTGFGMLGPDTEASLWMVFAGAWALGIGSWFYGRHLSERAIARRAAQADTDERVEREVARRMEQALAERKQEGNGA